MLETIVLAAVVQFSNVERPYLVDFTEHIKAYDKRRPKITKGLKFKYSKGDSTYGARVSGSKILFTWEYKIK